MESETTRNLALYVADHIMEEVYDDIEAGIEKDLLSYLPKTEEVKSVFLRHLNVLFVDFALNRSNEFKDPGKATQKAYLCSRITKAIVSDEHRVEKKTC